MPGGSTTHENPFVLFLERYRYDWVGLVREVFGVEPDKDQRELLEAVQNHERRVSWRSGHGVGKTTGLSFAIVCHFLTRYPQRTACTAPTEKQLFQVLAADVKALFKQLPPILQEFVDIQVETIRHRANPEKSYISFGTSRPETPEALAGVHSDNTLLVADEASGVHDAVFEAASGSMSGHNATTILAGNPVRTSGLFFDTHHKLRGNWRTLHTSCVGHPRISDDFIEDMKGRYGDDSNAYRVRVLGEFPRADEDTIIPFELLEASLKRDVQGNPRAAVIWGLDVARFGSDASALAVRKGNVLLEPVEVWKNRDVMDISGRVKAKWDKLLPSDRPAEINVDVIGMGAGVVDRLQELNLPVRGINVGETASADDQYGNLRAELWFKGRDWFAARDCNLCGDDSLMAELVSQKYRYRSNGKVEALSKDEMKRLGQASPNRADAFLLTLASDHITMAHGSSTTSTWRTPIKRGIRFI